MDAGWRLKIIFAIALCGAVELASAATRPYGLRYDLTFQPADDRADVAITLDQRIQGTISSFRFRIDPERHTGFTGDGKIEPDGDYVTWTPPQTGGRLQFRTVIDHQRPNGRFDAQMTDDWAIFRGDDIFPPARTEQHPDAEAAATLHVHLPERWSFVTSYPRVEGQKHVYEIEHAHRSFDRPTGWFAAGRLGVRRELIDHVRVIVAAPVGEGVRRLDLLALLNWTLPRLHRLYPDMPKRILIVSAGDPMFRGGLSGPNSLFIHADRPLLSENGSSTLVHELVHVANRLEGEPGADWIVEGIAEYYSLKILWRSGTISDQRYQQAFRKYAAWARQAGPLDADVSRGPTTARAVGILHALDREIHRKTKRKHSLDDVVLHLVATGQKVNLARLRKAVDDVMGAPADALTDEALGLTTRE